ncbi:hypothetical protein [Tractidigestivibacter scatoligenes]|nr:hypothetical protein [Tractidigestivibacter scatoligenes]
MWDVLPLGRGGAGDARWRDAHAMGHVIIPQRAYARVVWDDAGWVR